jgi:hypothetical protein
MLHIPLEKTKTMKYNELIELVKEHGQISIEANVIGYNPMLGLINLNIHPDDRDKVFGDDDESNTNFHTIIYLKLTKSGKMKVSKENNKFNFIISDKGDFGPNTNGLGVVSVNPFNKTNYSVNDNNTFLTVGIIILVFFMLLFILLLNN